MVTLNAAAARIGGRTRWPIGGQLAASMLILLAPLILFPHAALLDDQNHAARIWILATGHGGASPVPFFSPDWSHITTDLGVDLVARALGGLAPADLIARLCLAAAILLPPAGAIALNARVHGGLSSFQLIIPAFAWTLTALAGFLNFQIGLGLALLFVAIDPLFARRGPLSALLGRSLCGLVVFVDHGLAFAFYALLLAGWTFGPERLTASPERPAIRLLHALVAVGASLIPVMLLTLLANATPGNHEPPGAYARFWWNNAQQAALALASPLITYNLVVDGVIALMLSAALGYAVLSGKVRAHLGLTAVAIALIAAAALMPSATPQGGWTDRRLPVMALLAALSAVSIALPRRGQAQAIFAAMALLLVATRTAWIGWNWQGSERLAASVSAALADVPAGAAVLPVQHAPTWAEIKATPRGRFIFRREPTWRHLPLLALVERHAFVPTLFAQRGVHPIEVNPPWDQLAFREGGDLASLAALGDPRLIPPGAPYVRLWRTRFDYVLVLNADQPDANGPRPLPPELRLQKDAGFAVLYRIVR